MRPTIERHIITSALIVKPTTDPIFSERCIEVRIEDEAAGAYIVIDQERFVPGRGSIMVDLDEWPTLRAAIDQMVDVAKSLEK
jgi:hypothetical protein